MVEGAQASTRRKSLDGVQTSSLARFFLRRNLQQRKRSSESRAPSTTVRSLRELQWSPSPASRGRKGGGVLATRQRLSVMPGEVRIGETHLHSSPLLFSSFTKEEGRRNADKRWSPPPHLAMRHAPHEGALACRRSTTALTSGSISSQRLGFRPGFLGRGLNGRYPPSPVPVQGCTSHPGHHAGRLIPKPPGSSMQNHPRAPHPLHLRLASGRRPSRERDKFRCN